LNGKFKKPRKGKNNDKAHPPIHPVRGATNLEGDDKRVFEFVTRRFLACCSNAAKGQSTNVSLDIAKEVFTTSGNCFWILNQIGLTVLEKNYLEVYPFESWSNSYLPEFKEGETYSPSKLEMNEGKT
jgi:DNA topoisomerase-3